MRKQAFAIIACTILIISCTAATAVSYELQQPITADHTRADITLVDDDRIENAKQVLTIAYGHTSHGSQLVTGMTGLVAYLGDKYSFNSSGADGALEFRDRPFSGANDLGNPNRTSWASATRNYLNAHSEINVIIWSWCGQASSASEADIQTYLSLMTELENDFPAVLFVYMTGHLDGSGVSGNLNQRNEQIRQYCTENNKVLYDFADIESYDPDGNYFLDKQANDNCSYDSDGNGSLDANWAVEWQNANPGKWYQVSAAHSQALNGNLKAYAAWWLWAELAEVLSPTAVHEKTLPEEVALYANSPNPFNASTSIRFSIPAESRVRLDVLNITGQRVATLLDSKKNAGTHTIVWNGKDNRGVTVTSGLYFCRLRTDDGTAVSNKMMFVK